MTVLVAPAERARRADACRACPHSVGPGALKVFCDRCNCLLAVKTRLAGETCPAGMWYPSTGAKQ